MTSKKDEKSDDEAGNDPGMDSQHEEKSVATIKAEANEVSAQKKEEEASSDDDESKAPLMSHISELRKRLLISVCFLLISFFFCFYFSQFIYDFLAAPLTSAWGADSERRMIFTALHEQFFTQVKLAFFAAFCLSFPIIAGQLWMFIAPGLYKKEKKAFLPFLLATPILFIIGGSFVYYFVMPVAIDFFISFEQTGADGAPTIQLEAKVSEYLSLIMQLIFAFGICFELPVLLTLLAKAGITSADGLKAKRKYAILSAFVVAAVLTPPDPLSQLGLAIPIILLFEISIIAAKLMEVKTKKEPE